LLKTKVHGGEPAASAASAQLFGVSGCTDQQTRNRCQVLPGQISTTTTKRQ